MTLAIEHPMDWFDQDYSPVGSLENDKLGAWDTARLWAAALISFSLSMGNDKQKPLAGFGLFFYF